MIEKWKKPWSSKNAAPESRDLATESVQAQANQSMVVTQKPQPTTEQIEESPPDRASREFREITKRLGVVTSLFNARPLQKPCLEEGQWCLPDVDCKTRITFSQTAKDAFVDNRCFCCDNQGPVLYLNSPEKGQHFCVYFTGEPVDITNECTATIIDKDSENLSSLTVTITNRFDGDKEILAADPPDNITGITASYDSATGILSVTGEASIKDYVEVLKTITYTNKAESMNMKDRTINFVANDGCLDSNTAITSVKFKGIDIN